MAEIRGLEQLDELIRRARSIPGALRAAMPQIAEAAKAQLVATASAGTTPDGKPWAPRKDGGRAMAGAAKAISVTLQGTVLLFKLVGPEVFWHFGVRGAPPRHVIPVGSMPARIGNAIRLGFVEPFKKAVKGGA